MITILLTAQLAIGAISSSHPPLPPAQAVQVLRASRSPIDLTDYEPLPMGGPDVALIGTGPSLGPWDQASGMGPTFNTWQAFYGSRYPAGYRTYESGWRPGTWQPRHLPPRSPYPTRPHAPIRGRR